MERSLDSFVAEHGLTENDILFVETKKPEGWAFVLDPNEPKFYESTSPKATCALTDEPMYKKYWENAFYRPFSSNSSSTFPCSEYQRIKKIMEVRGQPTNKAEENKPAFEETISHEYVLFVYKIYSLHSCVMKN